MVLLQRQQLQGELCYIFSMLLSQSHSGILGGGHYISYANNPNGKWYCYNDSSCKEVTDLDTSSAYMLFYERRGVCETRYMPNISGRQKPDTGDLDEQFDSDLKKMCSVM
ncbi:Ubiquitin carboxyl-terminal hydrolase 32 [Homalodisca vitripennis]|nr:Ubiquitin carboxyl-terminal hydrolase 32 [Homalodisca vitripennis]